MYIFENPTSAAVKQIRDTVVAGINFTPNGHVADVNNERVFEESG